MEPQLAESLPLLYIFWAVVVVLRRSIFKLFGVGSAKGITIRG
jgi:hypothetical protein